jgi:hypothetical protein
MVLTTQELAELRKLMDQEMQIWEQLQKLVTVRVATSTYDAVYKAQTKEI